MLMCHGHRTLHVTVNCEKAGSKGNRQITIRERTLT